MRRTLRGSAQDHGALAVSITNAGSAPVRVAYLETLPWIVYLYLHTLELTVNGAPRRGFTFPLVVTQ